MPLFQAREVVQGEQTQGEDEEIIYTITTTPWASSPTNQSMVVKDNSDGSDVTAAVTSGAMSVAGDVITLMTIENLVAGTIYRVEVLFTAGGSVWEAYFFISAEV